MDDSRAAVVSSSMASLGSWLVSWAWMPRTWGSVAASLGHVQLWLILPLVVVVPVIGAP